MSNEMFYIDKKTGKKADTWIWAEMLGEDPEEFQKEFEEIERSNAEINKRIAAKKNGRFPR